MTRFEGFGRKVREWFKGLDADNSLAAVEAAATRTLHLTNSGATSWHGFTTAIMELAGIEVPIEAGIISIAPGAADRPLNGVLRSSALERAGLAPLRPWRTALADYLERAGLLAGAAA